MAAIVGSIIHVKYSQYFSYTQYFPHSAASENPYICSDMIKMKRSTNWAIFSIIFLWTGLSSCKPRKAMAFKDTIVQQERVAFSLLTGKDSPRARMLDYLIKEDYTNALAMINQQDTAFSKIIRDIETLSSDGITGGDALKTAALQYYTALKELETFDRIEITHQEATRNAKRRKLRAAQDKTLELSLQKQGLYKKVYEKEKLLYDALQQFDAANGI